MTFGCAGSGGTIALPLAGDFAGDLAGDAADGPEGPATVDDVDDFFSWTRGAGKFCFLSTASTSLWNRLNRVSARMRVDSRSMVLESSLTV